jgi:hypothetical protein
MFQKVLYAIFLGFLVCMFVVWAMAAWFPTPDWSDEYPDIRREVSRPAPPSEQELELLGEEDQEIRIQEYVTEWTEYREWVDVHEELDREFEIKMDNQGRVVGIISLIIAVVLTTSALLYSGKLRIIAEGFLLGGIFILIYSIGWCAARAPNIAVIAAAIGIVVTVVLGYIKYVRPAAVADASQGDP